MRCLHSPSFQSPSFQSLCVAALVLVAAPALTACETSNLPFTSNPDSAEPAPEQYTISQPIRTESFEMLWERARLRLGASGYRIDESRTRRDERRMVSVWKTLLAPSRYKGRRFRMWVEFDEAGEHTYRAGVASQTQRNTEHSDTLNEYAADWEEDPEADDTRARVLAYQLEQDFK